jgi:hypothetical protein
MITNLYNRVLVTTALALCPSPRPFRTGRKGQTFLELIICMAIVGTACFVIVKNLAGDGGTLSKIWDAITAKLGDIIGLAGLMK